MNIKEPMLQTAADKNNGNIKQIQIPAHKNKNEKTTGSQSIAATLFAKSHLCVYVHLEWPEY